MMPRVIVISGAVGALGTALCRYLVERGYRVAGVGLARHAERLHEHAGRQRETAVR
jgi:NADP-dependent 3-hydroxy acid dehydrogenase YdfG